MSFSSKVKNEISNLFSTKHCNLAEISAIINICGHIIVRYGIINIMVQTENVIVAKKYFQLIKKSLTAHTEVSIKKNNQSNSILYTILIKNINTLNLIEPINIKKVCCKRAYIRGAFLISGSLNNPEKTYHLEFVNNDYKHSIELKELINYFDMDAKIIERKGHYTVYLKDGEKIVDLLNIIGAHVSLMDLENLRIIKDMRNNVNRQVNCETANLNKTINASIRQLEDIEYIQNTIGLNSLPKLLQDIAVKRLMFPEASLKELGEMLSPGISKSGVNHRLKKISNIAENIKENQEDYYV